jgi:hypothetical protein
MFEIKWSFVGKVFVGGKFSHTMVCELPDLHAHTWTMGGKYDQRE